MMTLILAAALAAQAPSAPDAHAQHQQGAPAEQKGMDCCKDGCKCCKEMEAKHAGQTGEHGGHPAQ